MNQINRKGKNKKKWFIYICHFLLFFVLRYFANTSTNGRIHFTAALIIKNVTSFNNARPNNNPQYKLDREDMSEDNNFWFLSNIAATRPTNIPPYPA